MTFSSFPAFSQWLLALTMALSTPQTTQAQYFDDPVMLSGTGHAIPNMNTLLAKVIAYEEIAPGDTIALDSTWTDPSNQGYYELNFIMTSILEKVSSRGIKSMGNPYNDQARIVFTTPQSDKYLLSVFDISGRQLLTQDLSLPAGAHEITLEGLGSPGIKLVNIQGGHLNQSVKITQLRSNYGAGATMRTQQTDLSGLLKELSVSDEIILKFKPQSSGPEMYEDLTMVVPAQTATVDYVIQQIPYNFITTLKTFVETGEPVTVVNPNFTATVTWPGGESNTYSVADGQIVIEKELYPIGGLGNIVMHHDTNNYTVSGVVNGVQAWILLRQPNQKTNRPNVAQNPSMDLIPEYNATVSLDSLDGQTLHYYTIRKKAETQPNQFESMTTLSSIGLIASSGIGAGSGMFIDLKPFGVADSLNYERFGFNLSNNVPNTPAEQTILDNNFQQAIDMRYLPNGDVLQPPHIIYTITSINDPRHLAVIARGFENYVYTSYHNGPPENSRTWSNDYTYNGKPRLKTSAARYNNGNGEGTIFEENYSAITGVTEGVGSLAGYVWNATTNAPSQYGVSISSACVLLNLGTGNTLSRYD